MITSKLPMWLDPNPPDDDDDGWEPCPEDPPAPARGRIVEGVLIAVLSGVALKAVDLVVEGCRKYWGLGPADSSDEG